MKFLSRINRNLFSILAITLIITSVFVFFILKWIVTTETKESLQRMEGIIINQIKTTGEIPNIKPIVEIINIDSLRKQEPLFHKTEIWNEEEQEWESYLEYSNEVPIMDSFYRIQIRQPLFESEDLVLMLTLIIFILLLVAFVVMFLTGKGMNKTVWDSFEQNLLEIENFSFNEDKKLELAKTRIEEFDRLNQVITQLTDKLSNDYQLLKEFTENASHEIQTPISVALLNLEEFLQEDLSEKAFQKVVSSINALKRLSTLNEGLIMLAKIENRQFRAESTISLKVVVEKKLMEFESLIELKNLKITQQFGDDFQVKINDHLADILIGNLLSNAINHNYQNGKIRISTARNQLEICNTGEHTDLRDENIFDRFTKEKSKSFGLGLAIVKDICRTNDLDIHYRKEDMHCFMISTTF